MKTCHNFRLGILMVVNDGLFHHNVFIFDLQPDF
jgi:hypothetical protein